MNITAHQAKYFAEELTCRNAGNGIERLSQSLFDAKVDLNPHQIDAALFALKNPLQEGVLLADEVGLGKTVEAGLVLCQLWAERKRRLLVICPAALRKQWAQELDDKFALPAAVLDKQVLKEYGGSLKRFLADKQTVAIMSYEFAQKNADTLAAELWDTVVLDEAHKLRNSHKSTNKIGPALRSAFQGRKKILLTATPLQNSLMELYGLSTFLDEYMFGDEQTFKKEFVRQSNNDELRERLAGFVQRTLRKDVTEYIRYTRRQTLTERFTPTDAEHSLYQEVNAFIQREQSYALPKSQRHLTGLILRKLLASSPVALADTLSKIENRLTKLLENSQETDLSDILADETDFSSDYESWEEEEMPSENQPEKTDRQKLAEELDEVRNFIRSANNLQSDSKAKALFTALKKGFAKMQELGAAQKAVIFTESVRTQQYLFKLLEDNGYQGNIVCFSGSNKDAQSKAIYTQWLNDNAGNGRISGSPDADTRAALIDYFKNQAQIMIATEAAAEGVNLQFCSLLINYDLPWNPQRIEQRIGRCHRYGQKFDVTVINFLNARNEADARVLDLLTEKFRLFDDTFGASDEILGSIENDLDFEKRIAEIYNKCRSDAEIQTAFDKVQEELDEQIKTAKKESERKLLDNFDEAVHDRLQLQKDSKTRLDSISFWFWLATRHVLARYADFDEEKKSFCLNNAPQDNILTGYYRLPHQTDSRQTRYRDHRLNTPLGEWIIQSSLKADTPAAELTFDYSNHDTKISVIAKQQGQSGWLQLDKIRFRSEAEENEQLLFTVRNDKGENLDDDFCRRLLKLPAVSGSLNTQPPAILADDADQACNAAIAKQDDLTDQIYRQESKRLDKWAKDKIRDAEQAIEDTKKEIKQAERNKRQASNTAERLEYEKIISKLEQKRRRQRIKIWDDEDEINRKRNELIDETAAKLKQENEIQNIWIIRWHIK